MSDSLILGHSVVNNLRSSDLKMQEMDQKIKQEGGGLAFIKGIQGINYLIVKSLSNKTHEDRLRYYESFANNKSQEDKALNDLARFIALSDESWVIIKQEFDKIERQEKQ